MQHEDLVCDRIIDQGERLVDDSSKISLDVYYGNESIHNLTMPDVTNVKYCETPSYLHQSQFYLSLDADGPDEEITVPSECFKADELILNVQDFGQLLRTMIFWGLDKVPISLLDFCANTRHAKWEAVTADLPDKGELHKLLTTYFNSHSSFIQTAIDMGRREFVTHWIKRNPPTSYNQKYSTATSEVARIGNLQLLSELVELGYRVDESTWKAAAGGGHLDCLKYLFERGCEVPLQCNVDAAENGHLSCLKYLHEIGCEWSTSITTEAARYGHLECLKYAFEHGCPVDNEICRITANEGHLECMIYAHQKGCLLDKSIVLYSSVECLQYALQHGCAVDEGSCWFSLSQPRAIERIQLLRAYGAPWDDTITESSVKRGAPLLQFLLENGAPYVTSALFNNTVRYNDVDILQYLIEEQLLRMTATVFTQAVIHGCTVLVEYLVDVGCECIFQKFHVNEPHYFTVGSDIDVLHCITYALEHGWPCNNDLTLFVNKHELPLCQQYVLSL